ncbi:MAG: twin-arginine translocase subunit TatC [Gammaproteobacteria bacterium]|nr:twin-arginine translocase subunit TatC [Gammaproteobacteria bacterium]
MKPTDSGDPEAKQESLLSHLFELRSRLLWVTGSVLAVMLGLFPFANTLYAWLAGPLMAHLPEDSSMVAIEVASPFLTPFKLVFLLSIVLAIPIILYHAWAFIAPGLYGSEKRLVFPLLVSSSILFYVGMAFAYFIVFPLVFGFFTRVAPEGVAVMTDIGRYLDFVIKIFIAFGAAFEVPVVTLVLVRLGVTTPKKLASKRPYVIVVAFIVGMLLTPPDVISQVLLAIPVWLLFEIGLLLSRLWVPKSLEDDEDAPGEKPASKPRRSWRKKASRVPLSAEEQAMEMGEGEPLKKPEENGDEQDGGTR